MVHVFVWVVCVCVLVHVFMGKRLTRVDDAHLIGDASHAQSMMWLHHVISLLIRYLSNVAVQRWRRWVVMDGSRRTMIR